MLVHCWAGVSRSMASAFTILCDRLGPGSEIEIAQAIRGRAPACPSQPLLVRHADDALGRGGRMVDGAGSDGHRHAWSTEGVAIEFPLVGL